MIYAIVGLIFGIIGGVLTPGFIPKVYAPYFSVALMAGLDTTFGGLRAAMEGDYDNLVLFPVSSSTFFCPYFSVTRGSR